MFAVLMKRCSWDVIWRRSCVCVGLCACVYVWGGAGGGLERRLDSQFVKMGERPHCRALTVAKGSLSLDQKLLFKEKSDRLLLEFPRF